MPSGGCLPMRANLVAAIVEVDEEQATSDADPAKEQFVYAAAVAQEPTLDQVGSSAFTGPDLADSGFTAMTDLFEAIGVEVKPSKALRPRSTWFFRGRSSGAHAQQGRQGPRGHQRRL